MLSLRRARSPRHMMLRRHMKSGSRHMKIGLGQEIANSEIFLSDLDKKNGMCSI